MAIYRSGRKTALRAGRSVLAWLCLTCWVASEGEVCSSAAQPAEDVLRDLLNTPLGRTAPSLAYEVTLVRGRPGAHSWSDGSIEVTTGMLPVIGDARPFWAGVLGHEVAHIMLHHPECLKAFQEELRRACAKTNGGCTEAGPAEVLLTGTQQDLTNLSHYFQKEYAADLIGLMLMAEAGYHPDFLIRFEQRMRLYQDSPEFLGPSVSLRPWWRARQKRTRQARGVALAIFEARWPDIAKSPGGALPPSDDFKVGVRRKITKLFLP